MHVHVCAQEHVEIKGQPSGDGSLLQTVWVSESEFVLRFIFFFIFNFVCLCVGICMCVQKPAKVEALGASGAGLQSLVGG